MQNLGIWSDEQDVELRKLLLKQFLADFAEGEKKLKPNWKELFTDVYYDMPYHIQSQMESMQKHLREYGEHYPMNQHECT